MHDRSTGEDLDVLVLCPQGLSERRINGVRHYASSDQCGYIVGKLEGTTFSVIRGFSELDYGHTFYAPQFTDGSRILDRQELNKKTDVVQKDHLKDHDGSVVKTSSAEKSFYRRWPHRDSLAIELAAELREEGEQVEPAQVEHVDKTYLREIDDDNLRRVEGEPEERTRDDVWDSAVMLGWMGLPDADVAPTMSAAGWVHSLTMPRRVVLRNHRLAQSFLPDAETIRSCAAEAAEVNDYGPFWVQYREVAALGDGDVLHSVLLTDTGGNQAARIDITPGRVSAEINGDMRGADIDTEYLQGSTSIIVDGCTLEVLAGGGQIALSSMVYPSAGETWCQLREETSPM